MSLKTRLHAWLLEKTAPEGHPSASRQSYNPGISLVPSDELPPNFPLPAAAPDRAVHPVCRPTRSFADIDDYDDGPYVADDPWDSSGI